MIWPLVVEILSLGPKVEDKRLFQKPMTRSPKKSTIFTKSNSKGEFIHKGHITKVYSIKGGGLKNLHGFRLIGVRCFVLICIQMNPIRRNPCKFFSPPLLIE